MSLEVHPEIEFQNCYKLTKIVLHVPRFPQPSKLLIVWDLALSKLRGLGTSDFRGLGFVGWVVGHWWCRRWRGWRGGLKWVKN